MRTKRLLLILFLFIPQLKSISFSQVPAASQQIAVEWLNQKPSGYIEVVNGKLNGIAISRGKGKIGNDHFSFTSSEVNRIEISLSEANIKYGSGTTVVSIHCGDNSFSFFLRDVTADYPIYIPDYDVIVVLSEDKRSLLEIQAGISSRSLKTNLEKISSEPEESFETASAHTRNQICPAWLGISRDIRIFEIAIPQETDLIIPKMASSPATLPETNNTNVTYGFMAGRGQSVENNPERRLEDGYLPILLTQKTDGDIEYKTTTFVTLEASLLDKKTPIGTNYMVADNSSFGHMFTPPQEEALKIYMKEESDKSEETVLYCRVVATNKSAVPRYAWFRTLRPGSGWWQKLIYKYDPETGFSGYSPDRVFGISKLNGAPLPD